MSFQIDVVLEFVMLVREACFQNNSISPHFFLSFFLFVFLFFLFLSFSLLFRFENQQLVFCLWRWSWEKSGCERERENGIKRHSFSGAQKHIIEHIEKSLDLKWNNNVFKADLAPRQCSQTYIRWPCQQLCLGPISHFYKITFRLDNDHLSTTSLRGRCSQVWMYSIPICKI